MGTWKVSKYNVITKYKTDFFIVHNLLYEKGFMMDAEKAEIVCSILQDPNCCQDHPLFKQLVDTGCLIQKETDEGKLIEEKKEAFLSRNDGMLFLTIIPTYQCNFKCIYCWENTKDTNDAMKPEAQERLLKYINSQLSSFSTLNIDWFGGEPMLAFHVIKNMSERIDTICKTHKVPYFCSMTTNGFLLNEERFRFLLRHHTRFFQVTVDGPAEIHNRNRPMKGRYESLDLTNLRLHGRGDTQSESTTPGTFDRIIKNLRDIRDNVKDRFEFVIRLNVTQETHEHAGPFLQFYRDEFGYDRRFRLYIQGVEEHDGIRSAIMHDKYLSHDDDVVEKLFDTCIEEDIRITSLRVDNPGDLMCKSRPRHSYFVNSDGRFYKCDMCMNEQHVTYMGELEEDGTLLKQEQNLNQWEAIKPPAYCDPCVLQPLCFGLKCPYYNTLQGKTRCELFNSHAAARNAVKTFAQEGKYKML